MSLYEFSCECGNTTEYLVPSSERNTRKFKCPKCRRLMKREVGRPVLHGEKYQMKAILSSGEKVAGHFGKEAPRRRK